MNAEKVLETVVAAGGQLAVIDGGLMGKHLDEPTRKIVKQHKAKSIQLLQAGPVEPRLKPCSICNGLFFIHGKRDGYFCTVCQPGHDGQAVKAGGVWPKNETPKMGRRFSRQPGEPAGKPRINKTALEWLRAHRQALRTAGWTSPELYRRNKSKGIA